LKSLVAETHADGSLTGSRVPVEIVQPTVIFGIDLVLLSFVIVGILAFVLLAENVISADRGISNHESKL